MNLITNSVIKCECGHHIRHIITNEMGTIGPTKLGFYFNLAAWHFLLVSQQILKELATFVALLRISNSL
jgi:hypothetical protein